ncbi:hypothetical protein M9Y10_037864 [Tritrichomonas musculus]|uniref:C2 domain-containing protein n=1 Tax=Tritrichomonas musculus TaxID=1915356 RepID=A0ABR2K7H1_9EUKA
MSNQTMKTVIMDEEEDKKDLPSYMTSYRIFVRNISISQISQSHQETTNPYVTIRLKGGQKYSMTKSQSNTQDAQYDEILQLDGQSVGSDVLMLLVYNQNGEQNPGNDECLGIQKLVISSLELGLVKDYDLKLYKTIDGTTKKDYSARIGAAGLLHIEMQVAKLGTMQFQPKPWPPRIFYTLWLHVDKCKNVPTQKGVPVNPFIISKISPCLNQQKQTTPVCFNTPNPIWNILQCFHIDSFEKQTVNVTLMNYEEGSTPKKISSLKIPINLARTDGKPFTSQMLFHLPGHMTKGCIFIFKMQLLEALPGNLPFDGMVSMKHQKLALKISLYNLENLPESDQSKMTYCVVSCGNIYKKSREVQIANPTEINQDIVIHDITQSQLVLINVIIDNHVYGQVPIHLNNYLLKTKTKTESYTLFNKASAAVKYDLILTPEEPEFEEKDEISDQLDEGVEITVPKNINTYKNNYKTASSSANSSASSSAAVSPVKAPEAAGSERIKALLQQAKAGEMAKAVENTAINGSYVPEDKIDSQTQEKGTKINRVQQLASQINQSKAETTETTVSHAQTQSQSDNRANLAAKFLNSINSQKEESSSQQKVTKISTTQVTSKSVQQSSSSSSQTTEKAEQSQTDSNKIDQIKQAILQVQGSENGTDNNQTSPKELKQIKEMLGQIKDDYEEESLEDAKQIDQIKQSVAEVKINNAQQSIPDDESQPGSSDAQISDGQVSDGQEEEKSLLQPKPRSEPIYKHQSRRLSRIINNNHNLAASIEDEAVDSDHANAEQSDTDSSSSIPLTEKPIRKRYSSIRLSKVDLLEQAADNTNAPPPSQPATTHRATIAQKYLNQVNSNQQAKQIQIKNETTQSSSSVSNRVKQLASQYNNAVNSQAGNDAKSSIKRRSTVNPKASTPPTPENITPRRSSLSESSNAPVNLAQNDQTAKPNDTQEKAMQDQQISQPPQNQQEQKEPQSPRADNRANLAQKFLNQINSKQSSNVEKKSTVSQSTTTSATSDATAASATTQSPSQSPSQSPQINRVKQLASQINSVTSAQAQQAQIEKQSPKVRRATDASKSISSVPIFNNVEKRRASQTDETKTNSVKQLASQINNKIVSSSEKQSNEIIQSSPDLINNKIVSSSEKQSNEIIQSSPDLINNKEFITEETHVTNSAKTSSEHINLETSTTTSSVVLTSSQTIIQKSENTETTKSESSQSVTTRDFVLDDINIQDGVCNFDWGSNDSIFSSSFTGYSECSHSLGSNISDSAEKLHSMKHEDNDPNYKIKPEWHQKVYGQFLSAANLPIKSGKVFATLQLLGLGGLKHFKFTTKEVDPSDLVFNMKINFDRVKKGDKIQIILYSKVDGSDDHIPIGSGEIVCRNLKENTDEVYNVKLEKPSLLMYPENHLDVYNNNNDVKDFGEVQMSLNTNIEFTVLE